MAEDKKAARVLLVEDDKFMVRMYQVRLSAEGFEVETAFLQPRNSCKSICVSYETSVFAQSSWFCNIGKTYRHQADFIFSFLEQIAP